MNAAATPELLSISIIYSYKELQPCIQCPIPIKGVSIEHLEKTCETQNSDSISIVIGKKRKTMA